MPNAPVPAAAPGLPIATRIAEITRCMNDAAVLGAVIQTLDFGSAEREEMTKRQAEIHQGATTSITALFDLPRTPQNVRAQAQAILALHGPEWGTEDGDWMEWMTRRALENAAA